MTTTMSTGEYIRSLVDELEIHKAQLEEIQHAESQARKRTVECRNEIYALQRRLAEALEPLGLDAR